MKIISFQDIASLNITPANCVEWAKEAFLNKYKCDLPPKICQRLPDDVFITSMPCILPDLGIGGIKIVGRFPLREPSLNSVIVLYEFTSGEFLAMMDADWITTMRTGAVAALAIETLANHNYEKIGIIGLGNTARATIKCLLTLQSRKLHIKLKKYKKQAEFIS
jgi:ornithine cyclodeaminase/alanine dehydrogenase